jgi:hypothetical protein
VGRNAGSGTIKALVVSGLAQTNPRGTVKPLTVVRMPPAKTNPDEIAGLDKFNPVLSTPLFERAQIKTGVKKPRTNGIGMRFNITGFPDFVVRVSKLTAVGSGECKTAITNLRPIGHTFISAVGGGHWLFVSSVVSHSYSKWHNVAKFMQCDEFFTKSQDTSEVGWREFVARVSFLPGVSMHLLAENAEVLRVAPAPCVIAVCCGD